MTIEELKKHNDKYKNAVIFVGNGITKYFSNLDIEKYNNAMTRKNLIRNREDFYAFYNSYLEASKDIDINAINALNKLIELDNVVTCVNTTHINILKNKILSNKVINFNGNVETFYCSKCHIYYEHEYASNNGNSNIKDAVCESCGEILRPNIKLSGDLYDSQKLSNILNNTNTIITVGLDYSDIELNGLLCDYCELKIGIKDQENENKKIIISILNNNSKYDNISLNNSIGFHEFVVKDDISLAIDRLVKILK